MSRMEVGTFINDRYTAIEERLQIVRKRLNRPLSFSEKVKTLPRCRAPHPVLSTWLHAGHASTALDASHTHERLRSVCDTFVSRDSGQLDRHFPEVDMMLITQLIEIKGCTKNLQGFSLLKYHSLTAQPCTSALANDGFHLVCIPRTSHGRP